MRRVTGLVDVVLQMYSFTDDLFLASLMDDVDG